MAQNKIVKSPGALDLAYGFIKRVPVTFTVQGEDFLIIQQVFTITLNSLSHEDGSGTSFCFEGYTSIPGKNASCNVKGWFRMTTGQGWIEIVP